VTYSALVLAAAFLYFRRRGTVSARDLQALRAKGALILDVRTPGEYAQGHVDGSRNIPLGELAGRLSELNKDTPILACCASGMRSGQAVAMLRRAGFAEVHNAGSWSNLKG
jgi:rhodanese-related sulfurtransferase